MRRSNRVGDIRVAGRQSGLQHTATAVSTEAAWGAADGTRRTRQMPSVTSRMESWCGRAPCPPGGLPAPAQSTQAGKFDNTLPRNAVPVNRSRPRAATEPTGIAELSSIHRLHPVTTLRKPRRSMTTSCLFSMCASASPMSLNRSASARDSARFAVGCLELARRHSRACRSPRSGVYQPFISMTTSNTPSTIVPKTPVTIAKTARPMPCLSGCCRISRMAMSPSTTAMGPGAAQNNENNPA